MPPIRIGIAPEEDHSVEGFSYKILCVEDDGDDPDFPFRLYRNRNELKWEYMNAFQSLEDAIRGLMYIANITGALRAK